ncbi:50S ribosomal protein L17 [bacterium]|nr:50S ribosomal protein L17 [bacterium]MCI0565711.1 50S ribosomal protein L17 [bacterium]MCI0679978.1 50S ribosomal protein L17 [bacterium]
MRHHNQNRKFGRTRDGRKALLRSLSRSFFLHGEIKTTEAKAKEIRPFVEKLISKARKDSLHVRRTIVSRIRDEKVAKNLISSIAPRFASRPGGYTRIVKLGRRKGDASKMAIIQLVD